MAPKATADNATSKAPRTVSEGEGVSKEGMGKVAVSVFCVSLGSARAGGATPAPHAHDAAAHGDSTRPIPRQRRQPPAARSTAA